MVEYVTPETLSVLLTGGANALNIDVFLAQFDAPFSPEPAHVKYYRLDNDLLTRVDRKTIPSQEGVMAVVMEATAPDSGSLHDLSQRVLGVLIGVSIKKLY